MTPTEQFRRLVLVVLHICSCRGKWLASILQKQGPSESLNFPLLSTKKAERCDRSGSHLDSSQECHFRIVLRLEVEIVTTRIPKRGFCTAHARWDAGVDAQFRHSSPLSVALAIDCALPKEQQEPVTRTVSGCQEAVGGCGCGQEKCNCLC